MTVLSCQNGELQYADFTGPVLILLALALSLLISCNLNFSLVYIIEVLGTWFMYLLLNLTSQDVYIDMTKTAIILGYSLLPICLTPLIWIFARFMKPLAVILIYLCVGWSTSTASRLLTQVSHHDTKRFTISTGAQYGKPKVYDYIPDIALLSLLRPSGHDP